MKLLDASSETADGDLGESARKKIRVDVDMETAPSKNIDECQAGSRSSTLSLKQSPRLQSRRASKTKDFTPRRTRAITMKRSSVASGC